MGKEDEYSISFFGPRDGDREDDGQRFSQGGLLSNWPWPLGQNHLWAVL